DKFHPEFDNAFASCCSMEEIWQQADVVSLHIPLTPDTRKMVNHDWLSKFSKEIILINTSRGETAHTEALVTGIKSRKLKGLALDVLENEKINSLTASQQVAFDFLAKQPNVLFTPHIAGWSHESYARISLVLGTKIMEFYNKTV
ncbi:MAG: phosphoglycerate dehydrogenase, partial [Chitinophagaceae bacterium]